MRAHFILKIIVTAIIAIMPAASQAGTSGFTLVFQVPITCTITYSGTSGGVPSGNLVSLGMLSEYCNAPRGYSLVVNYSPGTMHGAVLVAGDSRVTLDGSGHAIVAESATPQIRETQLLAAPGANGFDTDRLDFSLEAR